MMESLFGYATNRHKFVFRFSKKPEVEKGMPVPWQENPDFP